MRKTMMTRKAGTMMLASLTLSAGCMTAQAGGNEAGGNDDIPVAGGAGQCDAAAAQALIGEQATQGLGAEAMRQSEARTLRWIPPNSAVTMDYRPDRLNVEYDATMRVTRIHCG